MVASETLRTALLRKMLLNAYERAERIAKIEPLIKYVCCCSAVDGESMGEQQLLAYQEFSHFDPVRDDFEKEKGSSRADEPPKTTGTEGGIRTHTPLSGKGF